MTKLNDELIEACTSGDLDRAKSLLEPGADVTALNNQAVVLSSESGHLEIVKHKNTRVDPPENGDNTSVFHGWVNTPVEILLEGYENVVVGVITSVSSGFVNFEASPEVQTPSGCTKHHHLIALSHIRRITRLTHVKV